MRSGWGATDYSANALLLLQVLSGLVPLWLHQLDCDFGSHLRRAERHKRVLKEVILSRGPNPKSDKISSHNVLWMI